MSENLQPHFKKNFANVLREKNRMFDVEVETTS